MSHADYSARSRVIGGIGATAPLVNILCFLDTRCVAGDALFVSKHFLESGASDGYWSEACSLLWRDKVYVPSSFTERKNMTRMEAYFESLRDSQRNWITAEELCMFEWCVARFPLFLLQTLLS